MILSLILAACLHVALAADEYACLPNKYEGRVHFLETNIRRNVHVDFTQGTLLSVGDDGFTLINLNEKKVYLRTGPTACIVLGLKALFPRCVPSDADGIPGNVGGRRALATETFQFQDILGENAFMVVNTRNPRFPIAYGLYDPATQKYSREEVFSNLRRRIRDPTVFNVSTDGCVMP